MLRAADDEDRQVAKCGNSVCPPIASALVEANAPSLQRQLDLPGEAVAA
jgi:hypothetical protein